MRLGLLAVAATCGWAAAPDLCSPSRVEVSSDGKQLLIGCGTARRTEVFDLDRRAVVRRVFGAARDKYECDRYRNIVRVPGGTIAAVREPVSAAASLDRKLLFIANALPAGRSDKPPVAAEVTVADLASRSVVAHIVLPNGSTELKEIRVSPDSKWAAVTHLLGRWGVPTTQLDRGWVQTNAVSLVDVATLRLKATVLLDEIDRGAANPWGVAWSADGKYLCVTHAGTHELSVIDAPAMLRKIEGAKRDVAADLSFLVGLRTRVALSGKGPRAVAVRGHTAYVASYFSEIVEAVNLETGKVEWRSGEPREQHMAGEMLFNDATIAFQSWLSCASCHGQEARVDGLNWDLLNDGLGNPNNVKSLLYAHRTPPVMSHGVRANAEVAVRAGLVHILFAERPESEATAIDQWLKSLQPAASPWKTRDRAGAITRGKKLFFDEQVGCGRCHPAGLFTTLKSYDVGAGPIDTPTLVEVWRTAPYMHDGSSATLRDVLTTANPADKHGKTSHLSKGQIDDLLAYLLTL